MTSISQRAYEKYRDMRQQANRDATEIVLGALDWSELKTEMVNKGLWNVDAEPEMMRLFGIPLRRVNAERYLYVTLEPEGALTERIARHEAERAAEKATQRRWADSEQSEYKEGFLDGYLRAHKDGQEYSCSIKSAELAFGQYLSEGGRTLPRKGFSPYGEDDDD